MPVNYIQFCELSKLFIQILVITRCNRAPNFWMYNPPLHAELFRTIANNIVQMKVHQSSNPNILKIEESSALKVGKESRLAY